MAEIDNIASIPAEALFTNQPEVYKEPDKRGILAKRFTIVPFSVLDARQGMWQDRKRAWVERLELRGEEGRQDIEAANNICSEKWGRGAESDFYADNPDRVDGHGLSESQARLNNFARTKLKPEDAGRCFGQDIMRGEHVVGDAPENDRGGIAGTSIFDPVLCESMYKWFAPKGGRILDPFAGGSTRGLVANFLGYDYTGVDIRPEQITANYRQAENTAALIMKATGEEMKIPHWILGDSTNLLGVLEEGDFLGEDFDFVWTCPPYYNLEIYSDKDGDGSQFATYPAFIAWYKDIFRQACSRLKHNRFVGITIGDVRHDKEKLHSYVNLEVDTVRVMEELGFRHYNRFVLVTAVGSLPVRIGAQFPKYRKHGNTHQMIYIFWKGECDHAAIPRELGVLGADEFDIKGATNGN